MSNFYVVNHAGEISQGASIFNESCLGKVLSKKRLDDIQEEISESPCVRSKQPSSKRKGLLGVVDIEEAYDTSEDNLTTSDDNCTQDTQDPDSTTGRSSFRMRVKFRQEEDKQLGRKTMLCFGSCCDIRRACLIVDTIYVIFAICGVVRYATSDTSFFNYLGEDAQDIYSKEVYTYTSIVQLSLGIVFSLVGFFGALTFRNLPVLVAGFWYMADATLYVAFFNWPAAIIIALYAYPHVALSRALHKGVLTRENYRTERHCCCHGCCREAYDYDSEEEEEIVR